MVFGNHYHVAYMDGAEVVQAALAHVDEHAQDDPEVRPPRPWVAVGFSLSLSPFLCLGDDYHLAYMDGAEVVQAALAHVDQHAQDDPESVASYFLSLL
jgi:hypothetical protein